MTDSLLLLCILLAALARIVQAAHQHDQLIKWLDAFADMSGDQRRELINQVKKGR